MLLVFFTQAVWGQVDKQYQSLPNQAQLPVANVHRILQDKEGFMWYATYGGGLCRDNGYKVDVFCPHQMGSHIPVQSNYIESLCEDKDGRIWMGTRSGLYYVDKRDYQIHEPDASLRGEFIYSLCCTSDGTVWLSLRGELLHIDTEGHRLGCYELRDNMQHPVAVRHLIQNSKGELMGCATWNMGLIRYDSRQDRVEYLPWNVEGSPQYMIEDTRNQCYWVCTWGRGVIKYQNGKAIEQPDFWSPLADVEQQSRTICMDLSADGTLWVSTMEFLYAYSTVDGKLTPLSTQSFLPRRLMIIDGIHIDRIGNVWVGGFTPSTFILSSLNHQIQRDSLPGIPSLYNMHTIAERFAHDETGGMWIYQSRKGITYITPQGEAVAPSPGSEMAEFRIVITPCRHDAGIWGVYKKEVGHLWHDQQGFHSELIIHAHDDVNDILEDNNGHIWVAGTHSLSCHNSKDGTLQQAYDNVGNVSALCCDANDTLYCISDTLGILKVALGSEPKVLLGGNGYSALAVTADHQLYVSTSDGRVLQSDVNQTTFTENTLLSSRHGEVILKMLVDPLQHVWTMTDQQVRESNPKQNVTRIVSCHNDEVRLDYFCDMRLHNGKVWLCGSGGMVSFEPNTAMDHPSHLVTPHISSVRYNDCRQPISSELEKLTLPYDARNISIEFTTLDYLSTNDIQYKYRLVGYDKDWIALSEGENTAIYAQLPKGDYILEVMATDRFGSWSANVASLPIYRQPAWWETWWFRTLVVLCLLSLLVCTIYLWNRRQLRNKQAQMDQHLTEMKFHFFTNISHELRTPLTLISTPLEAVLERLRSTGQGDEETMNYIRKKLQGISIHAKELTAMINRLLDFRKLEMKEQKLNLSNGDVLEFLRSAVESFRPLAEKQGIALGMTLPSHSLYINFDADKLHHIMSNLLSNAVKFTTSGGSVVTSARELPNKMLEISVTDTGTGIDSDELPHIFERYYQARNAQSGTGIGLQLVDSFCRLHGGSVSVESRIGQGSTFTVLLPTNLKTTGNGQQTIDNGQGTTNNGLLTTDDGQQTTDNGQQSTQRYTLLVVDDNAELRELLVDEFKGLYNIRQAANGQEALEILRNEDVDLMVSDVMMPLMDGFQLCEAIRQDINISHLLIILLTAKAAEESKLKGFKSGADGYLSKPFNMEMLKVRIATLLQQRSERHHAFQHQEELNIEETATDELDREFLLRAVAQVEQHLDEEDYSVEAFSSDMAMSKSTLYRKLSSISGQKPKEFVRTIRLRHAAKLLKSGRYTVSEVATRTGFSYVSYFCKCFKDMYGVQPGNYK